mgnify:FL=1
MKNKKIIIITTIIVLLISISIILFVKFNKEKKYDDPIIKEKAVYSIKSNSLEPFDLYFLQLENKKENKIYSPLSIKYALSMLAEGSEGESKKQILDIIYNYKTNKYENNKNISLANALFIKEIYKDKINNNYKTTLIDKYNAEVIIDSFMSPVNINSWVNNKTLGLINNLFDDISEENLILINALAIDMEWEDKFIHAYPNVPVSVNYKHEKFSWFGPDEVTEKEFNDIEEKISGMEIIASVNKYDIVNVLGENKIRKTVKEELIKYLNENNLTIRNVYNEDNKTDEELFELYLDNYIEEINSNYKKIDASTDFSFYTDENIKVFAKSLKEYNGKQLEYIGIMPLNKNLDEYVKNITAQDINNLLGQLKKIELNNFKDGVVTKITGFIPKFKFDYELDLMNDLKTLGIKNVFEIGKANLKNITSDELYINKISHKSNIEFTQDGIKAATITYAGGKGAGEIFNYYFEVPVEEIDLTFDKPYMFIIRDKKTQEVWFTGTVYNPLLYKEDNTKN